MIRCKISLQGWLVVLREVICSLSEVADKFHRKSLAFATRLAGGVVSGTLKSSHSSPEGHHHMRRRLDKNVQKN
ncbi:uncharacterized protein K489DRAFT_100991 [Dissoconium aciculare CBS 342.82]|uniref:Senescence domain-containing protein n=1 Tax=Dissoconium aciculare CBS 342.82 TaxID=1314786 RepID=A0A6J3MDD7_9PEZI|nr:uncharacterized protein K489DRAFT_100991 [Dissoconium aciculare CBS 342.82]KAF1825898.1 hypothetical protein K489DRAFT_100991 [Dissoconium aciculare CBS 342.82]